MKFLFTTFAYYPETSGVPMVVQYLAEGLAARGHNVCVATRKNGQDIASEEIINSVKVRRFDIGLTLTKRNTGNIGEYIDFVRQWPKDVLILECLQCHTTDLLLPYLKDMNCKVIIHSHGIPGLKMKMFAWNGDFIHSLGNTVNWFRYRKYYHHTLPFYKNEFDMGVSLSLCSSDMAYFTRYLKRVAIVENAANRMFFENNNYSRDISSVFSLKSKYYIVNISNYSDRKDQLTLIREYEKARLEDCALVLIGSKNNSYCERVRKEAEKVQKRSICEIKVLTAVDRNWFPSIIHNAMLFVMTSKFEEYPVSLIEAMAVGTPFISTMVGNAHTLPGGVVARDNEEISVLLKTLYDNPSLRKRLGEQGKQYALHNNTVNEVVSNFENLLKNIIHGF